MFNPNSTKAPYRVFPTHKITSPVVFITESNFVYDGNNTLAGNPVLQDNTQLLVLEHGLGEEARWCKVKTADDKVGFIMFSGSLGNVLQPLQGIKPFYNLNSSNDFQPRINEPAIDWKKQTINAPYIDTNVGAYVVHYEMQNVIEMGDKDSLINHMNEARYEGAKLILDNLGFNYTDASLNQLMSDYYLFCTAEEWYVDIRPCSTLRVAVAIPLRYLYAKTDLYQQDLPEEPVQEAPLNAADAVAQNPDLFVLSFENYGKYREFFDKLTSTLGVYSLFYPTKLWSIQPEIGFSLLYEIDTVKSFVRETDTLVEKNHPNTVITDLNIGKILTGQENFGSASEKVWQNSLDIYISKSKREITDIKYYSGSKRFSLSNGFVAYLNNNTVKDKTLVNYLLNFNPDTDTYDTFKAIGDKAKESLDSLSGSANATATSTNALEGIGNALGTLNAASSLLNPGALLTGDFVETSMRNFLIKNHYPAIISIVAKPLDLLSCTIDSYERIKHLSDIKSPIEIEKWRQINATYERNKLNIEGDYFIRSIKEGLYLQDPNMRILLGIDTLPGKSAEEKLLTYISIAKTVDWTKFLGIAAQCLSQAIPIEDMMRLMKIYKEARKFIEQIFASNVCNPFLKNGLKVLNSFELPVLSAYNPNEVLARELQTALYKILTDVASLAIKKALEAAAKACTGNPNQNFNNPAAANPAANAIPGLDPNSQTNDPAINDILDDIYAGLSGQPTPISDAQKQGAKLILQNIISDITSCLSLAELCALYKGEIVNDEVYQMIISLVKRKYGSPYAEAFATREQIVHFFKTIGRSMDLSICPDIQDGSVPSPFRNGNNILCDDGRVKALREQILSDRGLTPDLIDEALKALKDEETKALEDILKLLNSDNPFDFSKAPDLGCKVFPSGETIAPSMQSFGSMLNSLTKTIYDTFDREAAEWYTITYSVSGSKNSLLVFDESTGEIGVNNQIGADAFKDQKTAILANKSATDTPGSDKDTGSEKNKLPSFIFKETLKKPDLNIKTNLVQVENVQYIQSNTSLNGDLQQQLDINLVFDKLKIEMQKGELLLSEFAAKLWAQVLVKLTVEGAFAVATAANSPESTTLSTLQPIINLLYALDTYLRKNVADNEELKYKLDQAYKVLGVKDTQEASGFFAAENGAAIYLVICEQLKNPETVTALNAAIDLASTNVPAGRELFINSNFSVGASLQQLLTNVLSQYEIVKKYYRTILNVKINYPDFDIKYQFGINQVTLPTVQNTFTGSTLPSYYEGKLYDIQKIETQKNKLNHIKITEIREVSPQIQSFITGNVIGHTGSISGAMGVTNIEYENKKSLFFEYIKGKVKYYGSTDADVVTNNLDIVKNSAFLNPYYYSYEEMHQRIKNNLSQKITSDSNKFLMLKRIKQKDKSEDPSVNVMQPSGSGQPYTQYLKLVLPQTPQQRACNIRPHYLDIDSIKNNILDEKANNVCIEKTADQRTLGNKPISSDDLKNLETSSTQDTLLRGMYQLAVRVFLHDLLLRSIPIFGVYDPQSLRDEPAFITFMAKMCESEMRGFDNDAFVLMNEFLLKMYKKSKPNETIRNEQIKKAQLFRDLVEKELKTNVLPKLAKRITQDTNLALVNNYPKDTTIKLVNLFDDIRNLDIISVENKAVYIKILVQKTVMVEGALNTGGLGDFGGISIPKKVKVHVKQKIYDNQNASSDEQVLKEFIASTEFAFLFKYIFPASQILNNLFIINCLSTTTRKQIVNTFRGTKYDVLSTCKIIQANGQQVAPNPNNPQALAIDPMEIIIGFLLQAVIKTPISILKGVAESSEPNLALVSTIFKVVRSFVPKLSSVMIPLTSIPLGLLPTPLTPVLPFMNPLLAGAYFATLAWFDDKPLDEVLQLQKESQEKNLFNSSIVCDDVLNQDLFYNDGKTPIEQGNYDVNKQAISDPAVKRPTVSGPQTAGSQAGTQTGAPAPSTSNLRQQAIQTIVQAVKDTSYTYTQVTGVNKDGDPIEQQVTKKISLLIPSKISLSKINELVNNEVSAIEGINGFTLTPTVTIFDTIKTQCIAAVKNYLDQNSV